MYVCIFTHTQSHASNVTQLFIAAARVVVVVVLFVYCLHKTGRIEIGSLPRYAKLFVLHTFGRRGKCSILVSLSLSLCFVRLGFFRPFCVPHCVRVCLCTSPCLAVIVSVRLQLRLRTDGALSTGTQLGELMPSQLAPPPPGTHHIIDCLPQWYRLLVKAQTMRAIFCWRAGEVD